MVRLIHNLSSCVLPKMWWTKLYTVNQMIFNCSIQTEIDGSVLSTYDIFVEMLTQNYPPTYERKERPTRYKRTNDAIEAI